MLELLNQLDGFDSRGDVKVITRAARHVQEGGTTRCISKAVNKQ